jgi:hypothetical protein
MSKDKLLFTFTDEQAANAYSFPVVFEVTGNQNNPGKSIETGRDGTVISTAPGWKVTVSADMDGDGVFTEVLTTNINGITKTTTLEDGSTLNYYNGPALNVDPAGAGDPGLAYYKLLTGHYSWVGDASGNTIEPLSGHGPLTDLLDYLFA